MKIPPIPFNEADRLAALDRYEILDTLPEQEFDDLALLAAEICGTPIALISLVDKDRQWFKAKVGLTATSTHRDISFCGHAVADERLLMVTDATQDDRFADNPLVQQDPSIRFYAGAPLVTPDHHTLGTLCVIDRTPKTLSDRQIAMLEALSRQVVSQLELRRSLTEQKQAAQELELAKQQAEEANASKSIFLANMSHELRTPLNSVIGFTNLLLKNKAKNLRDQDLQYLDRIVVNGKHLLSLLNDVLDLSKIDADRMEMIPEALDLRSLIQDVVDSLDSAQAAHHENLSLQAVLPDRPVKAVEGDRRRTQQVLLNLLSNALKFTDQGVVEVSLVLDEDGQIPLRVNVADSGIGIAADKLGLIFEAFRQADDSTSRRYGGTGLGLAISQAMCRAQGWLLEVDSHLGGGSTFSIRLQDTAPPLIHHLPIRTQSRSPLIESSPISEEADLTHDATILVIDDDPDARTLLERYAQDLGYRVVGVSSGNRGIELARSIRPSLITLDLCMPEVNGFDVLRVLREDPELRHIPVVVCSIIGEENRASLVGAVEILDKPVNPKALSQLIQTYTDPHSNLRPSTVLIVDDDPTSRELLTAILQDWGVQTLCAANGEEGLKAIEAQRPDLVLLDLMMPVLDGFSFIDHLRRQPQYIDLPIIICSAKELTPQERAKLNSQTQQVVRKGESLEQVFQSIFPSILDPQRRLGNPHESP